MPRGKKKGDKRRGEAGRAQTSEEENDTPENMSTTTQYSDGSFGDGLEDGDIDESSSQELFEEKLKDVIDAATQKSAKGRTDALISLRGALSKKYIPEFVINRKMTLCDIVERCLKKGKGDEQAAAAACAVLILVQLGAGSDSDEIYATLRPILNVIFLDNTASIKGRSACAEALGLCNFIAGSELEHMTEIMSSLEKVFKGSFTKGDGSTPNHSPEIAHLHTSALSAWGLLLSIAPSDVVSGFIDSHLPKIPQLLNSSDVELRIAAGEAIALMYELAREEDEDFEGDDIDTLCDTLKKLATDSNKHRAKKDRRQQRSSFRDIVHTVEEGEWPSSVVRFGTASEALRLDSWVRKKHYDAFSYLLRSGTNVHLQENELLRDVFGLGSPIPVGLPITKASKSERHHYNAASFKARTKLRGKVRDKRIATAQVE